MQRVLSYMRRAVDDYNLIADGDRIAVGVSGGKDSVLLLSALNALRRFYGKEFSIVGITLDMGFDEGSDFSPLREYFDGLGIEYHVKETQIGQIVFNARQEDSPCSLCARMRRGALHDEAKALGCNKLALGHNRDDLLETFVMNMLYEGRLGVFAPMTYLDRKDITVIRPLGLMPERDVIGAANRLSLPIVKQHCPADGNTSREETKRMLLALEKEKRGSMNKLFGAIRRSHLNGW
ncbi:MAG: tRNA 2-thiocytidine(32) synthetase TtcA [Clostridia bacterium]|nr:tRNA 2-thiocytidine(32) synthetase TtcA [Clostridia bacterium]